jgi:biopolymer transport protein ExbD
MKRIVRLSSLLVGLAFACGCAPQPGDTAEDYAGCRIPLLVRVHSNGTYALCDEPGTLAELESNLRKAVEGPTAFPVVEPDPGTTFSDVWPAIALGARLGFYRQGLATCGHTNVFFVPSREDEKLSPMVLAGFNGNTPPDGVDIARVHDGALALGSTNLPLAELRRHFRAKADKSQCVIVMPADHAPMSRAGEVLNAIVGTGNSNVCLVREVTVTQPTDQACRE